MLLTTSSFHNVVHLAHNSNTHPSHTKSGSNHHHSSMRRSSSHSTMLSSSPILPLSSSVAAATSSGGSSGGNPSTATASSNSSTLPSMHHTSITSTSKTSGMIIRTLIGVVLCMLLGLRLLFVFIPHGAKSNFRDLLINQELLPIPKHTSTSSQRSLLNENANDIIQRGKERAQQSSVTFLGVAKDVSYPLPKVLQQIDALAQGFRSSQAFLVEGDSIDETPKILSQWKALSPQNRSIINYSLLNVKDDIGPFNNSVMPREGRLALARNRALESFLQSNIPKTDYMIMIDLDIVGLTLNGVWDSIGRDGWNAICAHGVILSGLYRDTYAFRMPNIDTNHHKCGSDHFLYGITTEERKINRKLVEVS